MVWGLAFLLWFYWYDLQRWVAANGKEPKAVAKSPKKLAPSQPVPKRSEERILDDDRKALEALLKEKTR